MLKTGIAASLIMVAGAAVLTEIVAAYANAI